jgi:hypothetical protein
MTEGKYTSLVPALNHCQVCIHFDTKSMENDAPTCKAFPDGIPDEAWTGIEVHRKLRGDEAEPVAWETENEQFLIFEEIYQRVMADETPETNAFVPPKTVVVD